jgi:hypothetical protein
MAWTTEELGTWAEELGLPQEKREAVLEALDNETVRNRISEGQLRQSDYDRQMNEQKQAHIEAMQAADTSKTENEARTRELNEWYKTEGPKGNAAIQQLQTEREKAVVLETRLRSIGSQYGLEDRDLGLEGTPDPPASNLPAQPDLSGYVTREDFQRAGHAAEQNPAVTARMLDAAAKHQRLFGRLPENTSEVTDEALAILARNPGDFPGVEQFLADRFGFAAQEEALAKTNREKELTDARAEAREAALSEVAATGGQTAVFGRENEDISPVLGNPDRFKPNGNAPIADSRQGIAAAVEAYNKGTYRPGVTP